MASQSGSEKWLMPERNILLFGSLALTFDAAAFNQLRSTVVDNDDNGWLADVVASLQDDCEIALSELYFLKEISESARRQLADLRHGFMTGRPLETTFPLPNALLIPLVIIAHLTQYKLFVQQKDLAQPQQPNARANYRVDRESLGLCTGILSAFVVASAHDENEFRTYGAAAVRLGMLIGLAVDSQDTPSDRERLKSLSTSWNSARGRQEMERVLEDFPNAYISVHYDENRVTITTSASNLPHLVHRLRLVGLSAVELNLYGGFHSAHNSAIFDELNELCNLHDRFRLPDAKELAMPTRANDRKATYLTTGSLHTHALRSILLEPPHWFDAFCTAASNSGKDHFIISFGTERSIPPSLMLSSRYRIIHLAEQTTSLGNARGSWWPKRITMESDIAVVGMACKVAGANNIEEFWDLLAAGNSQHCEIGKSDPTKSRFDFQGSPFRQENVGDSRRKWFANLIDDENQFDHRFFKKSARECASMDPQQRQLLQVAYQAVEQSGYLQDIATARDLKVGCFVGTCLTDYENNVACHAPNAFTATGNLQGFIAGKVSHYFGWTGPGLTIDTACSSSLVAVHQACSSILAGECNAALAGGTHIMTSPSWFQNLAAGSFLSPTGQCKPFDAKADGYCRGEGVGAVFLKRMSQALADGDQILGVIAASAVQQNQNCTPIFVPNSPSLTDLFTTVISKARVKASQISVVEAHGTGTVVGDPAEYGSIRQVLGGSNRTADTPLMISSVKGLVGHMECTSGIISLIKILIMLNKGIIPPQASFDTINPAIGASDDDNMFIPTCIQPWNTDYRVALINNYGASGSNAAMVVAQAPSEVIDGSSFEKPTLPPGLKHPFYFNASDEKSLRRYIEVYRKFLIHSNKKTSLSNISFNLAQQSNRTLDHSLVTTARSVEELIDHLAMFEKGKLHPSPSFDLSTSSKATPSVVLCFGGQNSTSIGLDRLLYENISVLRKHLNEVDNVIQSLGSQSIFPEIFSCSAAADPVHLQTMLFAIQYAFARSWIDSGVRPAALVGHSFGELTALCISQTLSLEDTTRLIISRAKAVRDFWGVDKGAMVAVEADLGDVQELLRKANAKHSDVEASIACYNGSRAFTLAGSTSAIELVVEEAQNHFINTLRIKRLNVTNAFHSALVEPLINKLQQCGQGLTFRDPIIPIERATKLKCNDKFTASFVADHLRKPVYFHHAVERLLQDYSSSSCVFLEAGSNSTVAAMAARVHASKNGKSLCVFQGLNVNKCDDAWDRLTDTTASLWKVGLNVRHWAHHGRQRYCQGDIKPLFIPPYQFDPEARHWLEIKNMPEQVLSAQNLVEGEKHADELLILFGRLDEAQKGIRFQINTSAEKYKKLLKGHLTLQTAPICPATVQIGFVIDAIYSIHPEYLRARQPQIQEVEYQSPVCANTARCTWIEVVNTDHESAEWQFEVFSTDVSGRNAKAYPRTVHTKGTITFSEFNDILLKRDLNRFERHFGHHRAMELLQSSNIEEMLGNKNIYRIFAEVVDYGAEFRGVQKLVRRGNELASYIIRTNKLHEDAWRFDAHLADTFCQPGGIWINCMTERPADDVYLANKIEQWIRAPPRADTNGQILQQPNEFHVFATNFCPSDRTSVSDVFVFDAANGDLVEVILGITYVKIPKTSMVKLLTRLTEALWIVQKAPSTMPNDSAGPTVLTDQSRAAHTFPVLEHERVQRLQEDFVPVPEGSYRDSNLTMQKTSSKVKAIIADMLGIEAVEINDNSELADLGIDSLAAMELVHELDMAFEITLAENDIICVTDITSLVKCIANASGMSVDDLKDDVNINSPSDTLSSTSDGQYTTNNTTLASTSDADNDEKEELMHDELQLSFRSVMEAFQETKQLTDMRVAESKQTRYVADSLPRQNELTVTLTIEAFESLGAGFQDAKPGQKLDIIPHGKEHHHLVLYLYRMLETETQIIKMDGEVVTRTAVPMQLQRSRDLYESILSAFPDQHVADKLTYYAGTNLKRVLSGEIDGSNSYLDLRKDEIL